MTEQEVLALVDELLRQARERFVASMEDMNLPGVTPEFVAGQLRLALNAAITRHFDPA